MDNYPKIFIHSFSVGACTWGVCQRMMEKNQKYEKILERVVGQVWDSVTHHEQALKGIPTGLFPSNQMLQYSVAFLLQTFFKIQKTTIENFSVSIDSFINNKVSSPALLIGSKVDRIARTEFLMKSMKSWQTLHEGMKVDCKIFNDSDHVKHYQKYPEEYLKTLQNHWDEVKLFGAN
jgi:hypothetical protein